MASQAAQSYANHRRFVPGFHFVTLPLLALNLVWWVVEVIRHFSFGSIVGLLTALALVLLGLYARSFAATLQDRLIRLEMRLRLADLLPPDLKPRIGELTRSQLVGLRFASDAEMADLVRRVLDEKIPSREAIKKLVRDWQADDLRV